ncbi:MAG TPA: penicillin acylase family protein [Vicinamibacterales bacterium]|nr:penicillin acylase family protein [Vicinamibacterales bacterium]
MSPPRLALAAFALTCSLAAVAPSAAPPPVAELWRQVEVIRTAHGVPHIRAENLRAAGYALAWVMSEDYGSRTGLRLLGARGELSRFEGRARLDGDVENLQARARAIETYHLLDQETRDIYDGFAAGVNRYVALHPAQFPGGMPADFSGYDVATLHIGDGPPPARVRRFLAAMNVLPTATAAETDAVEEDAARSEDGSNAWALAPSRTKSGKAMLLRNPHLAWTAGYYEAHVTVPGVVDFYGDFRIGGPLIVIGGFNRHLGWATTNSNSGDLTEFYALDRDPDAADRYLLDGASLPLRRESYTVQYKDGETLRAETRELWSTPFGRVVHLAPRTIFLARTAGDGEFRAGEQFLRMMRAASFAQWKDAMTLRALVTQNYTYADRAGNIFNLWNAALPLLPHPPGNDAATAVREMRDMWTRYIPFAALPQVRNPPRGYVHNENDSPHFANVHRRLNLVNAYPNMEPPSLRLRSQHAIQLVGGTRKFSLEDVVRAKHSYRMLLADRVKRDLIAAVRATRPSGDVASAIALLRRWNNTAAPASRGATLFEIWFLRYAQGRPPQEIFAQPWTESDPLRTPRGLADAARAAEAFSWAVEETARRHGRWDVAWGEVHRVRRGPVDVPVGGCSGVMGCFRVLTFARDPDGKLSANSGDGWVLAVEFADVPRAYSVLAYGQSPDPASPWHADQAAMFARGEMKRVAFTRRAVDAGAVARYRPGRTPE